MKLAVVLLAVVSLAGAEQEEKVGAQQEVASGLKSVMGLFNGAYKISRVYYKQMMKPIQETHNLLYHMKYPNRNCDEKKCATTCETEGCGGGSCDKTSDICYCRACAFSDMMVITKRSQSPVDYLSRPLDDCDDDSCRRDCTAKDCASYFCEGECICLRC